MGLEFEEEIKSNSQGTSLAVQWLRLGASTAGGTGSIPGHGTKIPHATLCSQKKKKKSNSQISTWGNCPNVYQVTWEGALTSSVE